MNIARAILGALSTGGLDETLPQTLADAVLDHPLVRLALQVREGGPDAVQAALTLAFQIVAAHTTRPTRTTNATHEADPSDAPVPPKRSTVN